MDRQQHWEKVYGTKAPDQVSWFRPHLETSLALIERATRGDRSASIIDIGGGASTLVDDLLERGYHNVTVLDISQAALDMAQKRLGNAAKRSNGCAPMWCNLTFRHAPMMSGTTGQFSTS